MKIKQFIKKLADPIEGTPLRIEGGFLQKSRLVSALGRTYPVIDGIVTLMPTEADFIDYYGRRNYFEWRALQDVAESSYDVKSEGHFSVDSYQPAVDYGKILATLATGEYLDVGCGGLALPAYMKDARHIDFFGLDPYSRPVARKFPFIAGCADFLPFSSECFDGVMFSSSLDHTINPKRALEEAARVLRPGGLLIVWETMREPKRMEKWQNAAVYFQTRFNKHHNWCFDRQSLESVSEATGFSVVSWNLTSEPSEAVLVAKKI